jgi:hypothetical protein
MKKNILILATAFTLFSANVFAQQGSAKGAPAEVKQHQVDQSFSAQLAAVFDANLKMKDAFVASSASEVKTSAQAVADALAKIDMKLLKGDAHSDWMAYSKDLKEQINIIAKTTDLNEQRKAYKPFNDAFYKAVKAFGVGEREAFYQYCPMALNNTGGHWFSDNKEIRNPYYGSSMLKCGKVVETIK